MHYVDTLILPLLFSVFLVALGYLGWRDIQTERQRRKAQRREEGRHPTETRARRGGKS